MTTNHPEETPMQDADQHRFVASQYSSAANLDARAALHAHYSANSYGWFRWVWDQFDLRVGDCVLELGCGTGELWASNAARVPAGMRLQLTDLSQGMVDQAAARLGDQPLAATFARVDAQSLPYPDGRFDVVIANHMLYHVPDRDTALQEIARVLTPGGRFYATTIGEGHMADLYTHLAAPDVGYRRRGAAPFAGFTLENGGAQVSACFDGVTVRRYPDELRITAVQPLLDYYQSMGLEGLETRLEQLREHLQRELAAKGSIRIGKDSGMILAFKPF